MSILNRRNAVLGWATLVVGKRVLKRKAKAVVPALDTAKKRPSRNAVGLVLAVVAGVVTFLRARAGGRKGDVQ